METRINWGMIVFGVVFAIAAIAVAFTTYYFESKNSSQEPVVYTEQPRYDTLPDADNDGIADWQELIMGSNPQSADSDGDGLPDGSELAYGTLIESTSASPTVSLTEDLVAKYTALQNSNSLSERELDAAAKELIDSHVSIPDIRSNVTKDQLIISPTASLGTYSQLLLTLLRQSTQVKEHELITFRRSVEARNYSGTPALRDVGKLYKNIQDALIKIDVPQSIANEHLETVNAIGSLAHIVTLMSTWDGDPLTGLVYVDTFNNAEAKANTTIATLIYRVESLMKKS